LHEASVRMTAEYAASERMRVTESGIGGGEAQ
jgi:hypothetical protein